MSDELDDPTVQPQEKMARRNFFRRSVKMGASMVVGLLAFIPAAQALANDIPNYTPCATVVCNAYGRACSICPDLPCTCNDARNPKFFCYCDTYEDSPGGCPPWSGPKQGF